MAAAVAKADAPGRVNLIGEHTDYHLGPVLPAVIPLRTRVAVTGRADRHVRVSSSSFAGDVATYELGAEAPRRAWVDYVQGVTAILTRLGVPLAGFDASIDSDVPPGAGLASSAALEVSLLRALRSLFGFDLDDVALARAGQRVETEFVGAPVGIMDQMAASLGRDGEALCIDTRTLDVERVPLPASVELLVIHSGLTHAHAGGGYVERRRESFDAAQALGVSHLSALDVADLPRLTALPDVLARRARHVITEIQRVREAVDAFRAADLQRIGELFAASHRSMRDDYEISHPDIDALVEAGRAHADIVAARLTGGGFGGAVVMIARAGRARQAGEDVRAAYVRQTGRTGVVLVPPLK
jgi:galactokinase